MQELRDPLRGRGGVEPVEIGVPRDAQEALHGLAAEIEVLVDEEVDE